MDLVVVLVPCLAEDDKKKKKKKKIFDVVRKLEKLQVGRTEGLYMQVIIFYNVSYLKVRKLPKRSLLSNITKTSLLMASYTT